MKVSELRDFDIKKLALQLKQEREDLQHLCMAHALDPIKNPMKIRAKKRAVARILTVMRQKKEQ